MIKKTTYHPLKRLMRYIILGWTDPNLSDISVLMKEDGTPMIFDKRNLALIQAEIRAQFSKIVEIP